MLNRKKEIEKTLPTTDIWQWSATDVSQAIRFGSISSVEATQSVLKRIEAVNPRLNAIINVLSTKALHQAERADELLADDIILSPLHGVPITIKNNVDVKGEANTSGGVMAYKDRISISNSAVVTNLNGGGCVNVGLTNCPEFSFRFFTDNPLFGKTLNPWNDQLTSGGSSGGAASAVVSGMGFAAHGNDLGGSVRYPAYACGTVGLRPTYGRIAKFDPSNLAGRPFSAAYFATQGTLTRTVNDARLMFEVMCRENRMDQVWAPIPIAQKEIQIRRIGLVTEIEGLTIAPDILENLHKTAKWLEKDGYIVEEIILPEFYNLSDIWGRITMADKVKNSATLNEMMTLGSDDFKRVLEDMSTVFKLDEVDLESYISAIAERDQFRRRYNELLEIYPVIMLPISSEKPAIWGSDLKGVKVFGDFLESVNPTLGLVTLNYPSMNVPTGLAEGNIPQGVQLFAADYCEEHCFQVAECIEQYAKMPFQFD